MILTGNNVANIDQKARLGLDPVSDIHPPPYSFTTAAQTSLHSCPASQDLNHECDIPPLLTEHHCNWVYAYNAYDPNNSNKNRYILDPSLKVPSSLISEAAADVPEAARDILNLEANTASVDVVARIVDSGGDGNSTKKRRARITLCSTYGSVRGKILSVSGSPPPKFHLTATTNTGNIYIYIPRSFHGPISASTTHGSIHLSDELVKNTTTFADGQKKK